MRKRILVVAVAVVVLGCLAVAAIMVLPNLQLGPGRLALTGGGGMSIGETTVEYVSSQNGIALVIWTDSIGSSESGSESSLFSSTASGSFSSADGKRIDWEWKTPRKNGGEFHINGTPHDLTNGTLLLVTTRGGKIEVTQLDVDLSKVEPDKKGFEALARKEEKVAKFIADARGQK